MSEGDMRVQWEGHSWRLLVERVPRPDAGPDEQGWYERAYVDHPGAVVLVPLRDDETVLMLRQHRPALDQTILELPAGTREGDEAWLVCAQRELREETGFRAATFTSLGEIWPTPGYSRERMMLYLATGLTPDPLTGDFDEQIELEPTPLAKLATMALDGELQDAKSVIGILRTVAQLQSGRDAGGG